MKTIDNMDKMTDKANEIALELTDCFNSGDITVEQVRGIVYSACIKMANDKDEVLKKFLEEHANPDIEMKYNEDGLPLAESFIEWNEARLKAGDALFKRYKEYEETWL
jgi:hypothetical protein